MSTMAETDNIVKSFGHCIINWTIENFCLATCKEDRLIYSPDFYVTGPQLSRWRMILYPKTDNGHILLQLARRDSILNTNRIWANWKVCLMLKHDLNIVEERTESFAYDTAYVVDLHELEDVLDDIHPLDLDELKIQCQLLVYDFRIRYLFRNRNLASDEGLESLSEDLWNLYLDKLNYDIVFRIDDISIKAHKAILYFRNRNLAEIIDKQQGKEFIELSEVNCETMNKILHYLYSGNMEQVLVKPSISLYESVHFFDIVEVMCYYAPEQLELHSTVSMQEISYFWEITRFSDGKEVVSPNLSAGISSTIWRLYVYPVGQIGNQNIALTAEVVKRIKPQGVCLVYGVVDAEKNFFWAKRIRKYIEFSKIIGTNYFIKGRKAARYLLDDDTLRIKVKIQMATGDVSSSIPLRSSAYTDAIQHSSCELLSEDMKCVFESKKFSDLVLHVEEKDFDVHKCILSARSPYFADMIENMAETETNISIANVSPDVMYIVLRYIYCGTLGDLELENYQQVYEAAKYLKISSLEDIFSSIL